MYTQHKCYRVQKCKGNGLYLAPHPRFVEGNALFLKHGNDISDGDGLLIIRLRIFPFWDGYCNYCNYLEEKYVYRAKYPVLLLSVLYS